MADERLTGSDKRALILWVLLGLLGSAVAYKYFFQAFPEASVNLKVSRQEALQRAKDFVASMGADVGSYKSAIVLDSDDNAKTYLEREVGLQKANQLMSTELNIWYWDARFFKPEQEEEFHVRVSQSGQVVGYEHKVPEAQAGASLDRGAAQIVAESFFTGRLNNSLSDWELLPEEVNSTKRPNRLDWSFTWEKRGFRAKDAPYRQQVLLHGDQVAGDEEFLKVPEAWQRSFAHLRSQNNFLTTVALVPYVLILGAALWLSIALTRRGQARWAGAIKIGVVVAALLVCMGLNEWPTAVANYDTNSSYSTFIFQQIATALLFGILSAITVTLVLPAAESLYQATQPDKLRLRKIFTWRGLRTKEFFSSAIVGLSLTGLSLGYVVVFYLVGGKLGVWAPQELSYTNSVSTAFPWISGVAIGLFAATNEEFTFRLFAIPFLERLTGSRWLAVILPAFAWSFLHTNYPQEPPYIRGIEIGLVGLVAGVVMLRWGIMATLIWHYTFDALQVGLVLIRSNSVYFKISGVVVGAAAVAPLAFACVSYLTRGHFEDDADLLNSAEPAPDVSLTNAAVETQAAARTSVYQSLSPGMLGFLGVCLLAGGILVGQVHAPVIGDYLRVGIDAPAATARGNEILKQDGVDPASYRHATVFVDTTDPLSNEYLRRRVGVAGVNEIYSKKIPSALWRVRYFREGQPEEYSVILRPDGTLHSVRHTLGEDAEGASLSKEAAQEKVEQFLHKNKQIDLATWSLVESHSDKRPHRTDHTFIYQENAALDSTATASGSADSAHARIEIEVLGDQVANYRTYVYIPDDWRREQNKVTLVRVIFGYAIPILFFVGLGITALVVFLKNLRSEAARSIPWRRLARWALWSLLAFALVFTLGNQIPNFLNAYQTSMPLKISYGAAAVGVILGAPFYFAGTALLFGLAWFFAVRAFGEERMPGWRGMPRNYYRDALFIGLGGAALIVLVGRVLQVALMHWSPMHRAIPSAFGQNFDAYLPAGSVVGHTLLQALLDTGLIALTAAFVAAQLRQVWLRVLLGAVAVVALAGMGSNWGNLGDLLKHMMATLILYGIVALAVRFVMRFNIMGCFLGIAAVGLAGSAAELIKQPNSFYKMNGYSLVAVLLGLLLWPALQWATGRPGRDEAQPAAVAIP